VNWLDFVLLIVIGASVASGLARGFARIIVGMAAAVLAVLLAIWFYGPAGGFLAPYVSHVSVAHLLGFLIVFCGVLIAGALAAKLLAVMFKWVGLGWLDRLMGGALGAVRGLLFAIAIILMLMAFAKEPPPESVAESSIAPYVVEAAGVAAMLAPRELRDGFDRSYEKTRKLWEQALRPAEQKR
jgi:membrane protein required for colicin V production